VNYMSALKKTCQNNFGLGENVTSWLKEVGTKFPKIEKILIFGSRATGHYKNYSDIDIAISAPTMTSSEFSSVCWEMESLPIIYKMDILHLESLGEDHKLRKKIIAEGKPL